MRHTEVAERPCERGYDLESTEFACLGSRYAGGGGQAQIAGYGLGVCDDLIPAAGRADAEDKNRGKCKYHDKALNKARYRCRLEAAAGCVSDDNDRAYYHCGSILEVKQRTEQLAAGSKAGGGVGNVENDNHKSSESFDYLSVVTETASYVFGQGDSSQSYRIPAQTLCNEKPVEVSAERKTYSRPACLRDAVEEGKTGNAHKKPCAHVRGLCGKCCDDRAELAAAEVELVRVGLTLGIVNADSDHAYEVDDDGYQDTNNIN